MRICIVTWSWKRTNSHNTSTFKLLIKIDNTKYHIIRHSVVLHQAVKGQLVHWIGILTLYTHSRWMRRSVYMDLVEGNNTSSLPGCLNSFNWYTVLILSTIFILQSTEASMKKLQCTWKTFPHPQVIKSPIFLHHK